MKIIISRLDVYGFGASDQAQTGPTGQRESVDIFRSSKHRVNLELVDVIVQFMLEA